MKLSIAGQVYDPASVDRLTLREIIALETATVDLGRPLKWAQIKAMSEAAQELDPEEFAGSDDALWVIALVIYASKLRAGEDVTFADAVDVELGQIDWIPEPGDERPATQDHLGPKKAPRVSARAGSPRAATSAKKKASASR